MALLTKSGRIALAASLKNQALHLAWGSGSPPWETNSSLSFNDNTFTLPNAPVKDVVLTDESGQDITSGYDIDLMTGNVSRRDASLPSQKVNVTYTSATPSEDIQSDALIHEIGRRVIDEVSFCEPDPEGFTVTPTGRFSKTDTPTNQLYFHCTFEFEDAADQTIRELGIFIGTKTKGTCPPGQRYFLPTDLEDPGILLVIENTVPIIRTAATREAFSFVITRIPQIKDLREP